MEKRGIIIYFLFVSLLILSFYLDNSISLIASGLRTDFLNNFFIFITRMTNEIFIFLFFMLFFIFEDKKRKWILPLGVSFFLGTVFGIILKLGIQRARPFQQGIVTTLPSLIEKSHYLWNFSFPSSHTLLVFCLIPILIEVYPKLKGFFISIALLVGISRIYLGLHFLSDVFAGAIIGCGIGKLIVIKEKENKFGERFYEKIKEKIKVLKRKLL
jgi:undecaprenyl-diphosphatase